MSIELQIDTRSFDNFQKQMDYLKQKGETSLYKVMCMIAMRIKTTAQLRLKGQSHVKTSRLINSIYMQAKDQAKADQYAEGKNPAVYTSRDGKFLSKMTTVGLTDNEVAIGSNVEYAAAMESGSVAHDINSPVKIEGVGWRFIKRHPGYKGDSYLNWALQNSDISQAFEKEMHNEMKFGKGVAAQEVKKKKR